MSRVSAAATGPSPASVISSLAADNVSPRLSSIVQSGYSALRSCMNNARVVMIGESTHGTDDFYRMRAEISQLYVRGKWI